MSSCYWLTSSDNQPQGVKRQAYLKCICHAVCTSPCVPFFCTLFFVYCLMTSNQIKIKTQFLDFKYKKQPASIFTKITGKCKHFLTYKYGKIDYEAQLNFYYHKLTDLETGYSLRKVYSSRLNCLILYFFEDTTKRVKQSVHIMDDGVHHGLMR